MRFGIIGINFKSAELNLREQISRVFDRLYGAQSIGYYRYSCILLSTCNRCELYFHDPDPAQLHATILEEIRLAIHDDFDHALYSFFDQECLAHLSKVAAGFDSAFVFESEIQRQVKCAYSRATQKQLPFELHYLFQKSLHNSKVLRTSLSNGENVPALPSVVAKKVLGHRPKSVLVVGNSEIGRGCVRALKRRGFTDIDVITRHGQGLGWNQLPTWPEYDVVIATSKTQEALLTSEHYYKGAPVQMIYDLGMPRCAANDLLLPVVDIDKLAFEMQHMRLLQQSNLMIGEKKIREIVARQFKMAQARKLRCAS